MLFVLTSLTSFSAIVFFYLNGTLNLMNYDAFARLNIARKVIDNITPGIGQIGGTWLPFPQLLTLPFIWNDFLWHSGLAGTFVSATAFVVGALFLEKTTFLLTKSYWASFITWLIFVTNQNLLLFQTSAMSESFFVCSIIMILYYLTIWSKSQAVPDLLTAAIWVMVSTLIRYEGWFVLIGSIIAVVLILLINNYRTSKFSYIEGTLLLYLNIACLGIFLWLVYCTLFFKNPFYWLDYYTESNLVLPIAIEEAGKKVSLLQASSTYSLASLWVNGLVTSVPGILGYVTFVVVLLLQAIRKKNVTLYLPVFIICNILFILLVYGYGKGFIPQIAYPEINLTNIFDRSLNQYTSWKGPNIRYGLIMAPFFAVFAGIFVARSLILFLLTLFLIFVQVYTTITPPYYLQFSIAGASRYIDLGAAAWMRSHYKDGLILISARRHEDLIFQTHLPYKKFIHEGTRRYWFDSLEDPTKHASWVVLNDNPIEEDRMPFLLSHNAHEIMEARFKLVYQDKKGYKIYKKI